MSKPMADTRKRRARRQFTDEFKASAVRLVLDEGKTVSAAGSPAPLGSRLHLHLRGLPDVPGRPGHVR